MAEQHYLAAQKAIDGLRLSFKSKKTKPKPTVEKLHSSIHLSVEPKAAVQTIDACDCCAAVFKGGLTTIDSGQRLCQNCLKELRG